MSVYQPAGGDSVCRDSPLLPASGRGMVGSTHRCFLPLCQTRNVTRAATPADAAMAGLVSDKPKPKSKDQDLSEGTEPSTEEVVNRITE